MKLSGLKTIDQVIEERRQADPDFAAVWDRGAFAREVADALVRYRSDHGLSQRDLAAATGLKQPVIARLEVGESAPSLGTLAKLSRATGLTFNLEIARGDVAIPSARHPAARAEYRLELPFVVRDQAGGKLRAVDLTVQARQLTAELRKLELCNDQLRDPSVSTDARAGRTTIALTVIADGDPEAVRCAMDICRTAIHAIGGSTPDWPTAEGTESTADFQPAGVRLEYV